MRRLPILIVFFLTGAAALIYQVAWVRQSTLLFGVSVYAYSIVLTAFMGGMAVGSYTMGRWATTIRQPLRVFSLLQIGIALASLLVPFGLNALMPLYATLAQHVPADGLVLVRALLALLLLAPPTILMGATLPLLTKLVARSGQVGTTVGQLYAADTLGAAIGCALTGLFLLRLLGVSTTGLIAAGMNLGAALLIWATAPTQVSATDQGFPETKQFIQTSGPAVTSPIPPRILLWAYALSGFVALGYEIVWARILAIFTLNAVFSFSIMLTTFLTGLTIGGWVGTWWVQRRQVNLSHFAYLQSTIGIAALLTLLLFARLPQITLEAIFGTYSVRNLIYFEFLVGFLTLFMPTFLLGLLFPIVVSLYTGERAAGAARQVGTLSAGNTAGGVVGALITGFILIPVIGLQKSGALLAMINISIGALLLYQHQLSTATIQRRQLLAGATLGVALLFLLPPGYYLGFREEPNEQMLYYAEGVETTVAVFTVQEENFKVAFVNGRIEVPTDPISMRAFRLLGHLPAILRPEATNALMLSFGNGIATGSLNSHNIPHIDAVDLSAEQFAAAELYWIENYHVLTSPHLQIYVEDGRNFLLQTPRRYDIITTDATHPVNTSSWALFTQEFYQLVAARLTADGVFLQWIPFHSLQEADYKMILRTFQQIFPHATLWYTGGSHTLLLATPARLTETEFLTKLQIVRDNLHVQDDLGAVKSIRNDWIMDEDTLRTYVGEGSLATDDNAYFLPDATDTDQLAAMMKQIRNARY